MCGNLANEPARIEALEKALSSCADVCEKEGRKLDQERAEGHPSMKDERRARAESAYFCAHLVREYARESLRELRKKEKDG